MSEMADEIEAIQREQGLGNPQPSRRTHLIKAALIAIGGLVLGLLIHFYVG